MELPSTETAQVDAQSEEWFASYVDAADQSSKRYRRVRHSRSRDMTRRKRRSDTMMMVASLVFIGAMTACFYLVLTH